MVQKKYGMVNEGEGALARHEEASPKLPTKRERTREAILSAAEGRIASAGVGALKARDIAADAGCSLGLIYSHFKDLDGLILRANVRTLDRLSAVIEASSAHASSPIEALVLIAQAYARFARDHTLAWAALFEHVLVGGADVPDWYVAEQGRLFGLLAHGLGGLKDRHESGGRVPVGPDDATARAVQTLFSAVHGVVMFAVRYKVVGVGRDRLEEEVARVVRALAPELRGTAAG